jgi:hypothetical protein
MLGMATSQVMQMPGVDLQLVMEMLLQYFLASLRIGAFLLSAPLFGADGCPCRCGSSWRSVLARRWSAWCHQWM